MPSLKEIKRRIASIQSTQKITSAIKIVSSIKLKKVQSQIEHFLPYQQKLDEILDFFLFSSIDFKSDLIKKRKIKRIALVVFSSNTSLCSNFNSNIIKLFNKTIDKYKYLNPKDIEVYAIGTKIENYVHKLNLSFKIRGNHIKLIKKPNFIGAKQIAEELIFDFLSQKIDQIELIYSHCKNTVSQITRSEIYLPIQMKQPEITPITYIDYIIEPNKEMVLNTLISKTLHSKIYGALLNSAVAEQTARVIAMQIATDNASEILKELTIQYNKQRQQFITNELLDVINGSEILK